MKHLADLPPHILKKLLKLVEERETLEAKKKIVEDQIAALVSGKPPATKLSSSKDADGVVADALKKAGSKGITIADLATEAEISRTVANVVMRRMVNEERAFRSARARYVWQQRKEKAALQAPSSKAKKRAPRGHARTALAEALRKAGPEGVDVSSLQRATEIAGSSLNAMLAHYVKDGSALRVARGRYAWAFEQPAATPMPSDEPTATPEPEAIPASPTPEQMPTRIETAPIPGVPAAE